MNLTTLQYFRAVAHSEQMTQSARELKVAQPALSRSIKKLEEEVGQPLFIRYNNRILLNKAGRVMLHAADNILAEWENALVEVRGQHDSAEQVIVMNVSSAGASVAQLIQQFRQVEPRASFVIHSHHNQFWVDKECDVFLFASIQEDVPPSILLRREQLYLSVGAGHPLAEQHSIFLKDCANFPFLFSDEDNDMYSIQMHYCHLAGFTPQVALKTDKQNILLHLLQLGSGVSLHPQLAKTLDTADITQLTIEDFNCFRYIHLMLNPRRPHSSLVQRFRDFCVDYFSHTPASL